MGITTDMTKQKESTWRQVAWNYPNSGTKRKKNEKEWINLIGIMAHNEKKQY